MKHQASTTAKKSSSKLVHAYLLFYNGFLVLGWVAILAVFIQHYLTHDNCMGLWVAEENLVKLFQTLAIFEIIHAAIGIVPSNPVLTAVQVASRLFIVWGVVHSFARIHNSITLPIMLLAWCGSEIVRYAYYLCHLLGNTPYALLWSRYSFFIVLYPLGVAGEILTTIFALPYIRDTQWYSLSLPNAANISFNYYYCVIGILLTYVPGFPQMYLHMLKQRKKMLDPSMTKDKKKVK